MIYVHLVILRIQSNQLQYQFLQLPGRNILHLRYLRFVPDFIYVSHQLIIFVSHLLVLLFQIALIGRDQFAGNLHLLQIVLKRLCHRIDLLPGFFFEQIIPKGKPALPILLKNSGCQTDGNNMIPHWKRSFSDITRSLQIIIINPRKIVVKIFPRVIVPKVKNEMPCFSYYRLVGRKSSRFFSAVQENSFYFFL